MWEIDHSQQVETGTCHECIDRSAKDGESGDRAEIAKEIALVQMVALLENDRWKKEHEEQIRVQQRWRSWD